MKTLFCYCLLLILGGCGTYSGTEGAPYKDDVRTVPYIDYGEVEKTDEPACEDGDVDCEEAQEDIDQDETADF